MKYKLLVWILVLITIVTNVTATDTRIIYENFESNSVANWTSSSPATQTTYKLNSFGLQASTTYQTPSHHIIYSNYPTQNITAGAWIYGQSTSTYNEFIIYNDSNNYLRLGISDGASNHPHIDAKFGGTHAAFLSNTSCTTTTNTAYYWNVTIKRIGGSQKDRVEASLYDTSFNLVCLFNGTSNLNMTGMTVGQGSGTGGAATVYGDNYFLTELDETPPIIYIDNSTYNMTSDGGCTVWRTSHSTYCNTTDGTPTVSFSTVNSADCSISLTSQSAYNSSEACSTTGGTTHICSTNSNNVLVYGTQSLYLACAGGINTDTSGALNINMTAGSGGATTLQCLVVSNGCSILSSGGCNYVQ